MNPRMMVLYDVRCVNCGWVDGQLSFDEAVVRILSGCKSCRTGGFVMNPPEETAAIEEKPQLSKKEMDRLQFVKWMYNNGKVQS